MSRSEPTVGWLPLVAATSVCVVVLALVWWVRPAVVWPVAVVLAVVLAVEIVLEARGSTEAPAAATAAPDVDRLPAPPPSTSAFDAPVSSGAGGRFDLGPYFEWLGDPFVELQCIRCGRTAVESSGVGHRCSACSARWRHEVGDPWPDTVVDLREIEMPETPVTSDPIPER